MNKSLSQPTKSVIVTGYMKKSLPKIGENFAELAKQIETMEGFLNKVKDNPNEPESVKLLTRCLIATQYGFLIDGAYQMEMNNDIIVSIEELSDIVSSLTKEVENLRKPNPSNNSQIERVQNDLDKVKKLTERWKPVISGIREAKRLKKKWLRENR